MKNPLLYPAAAPVLRAIGVDPFQYSLLLDLFRKLSTRQEFEVGNSQFSFRTAVVMFAILSGFINAIAAFGPKPPVHSFIFGNFVFTAVLVVMILAMESLNTFLNPVEASVLAHQPIQDRSFFAAKLTYLAVVVGNIVFPINLLPALFGLNLGDASWFFPVSYLVAAYALGIFIAVIGCGILGLLFRVLPAAHIRNMVLWVQIGFFVLIGIGPRVLAVFRGGAGGVNFASAPSLPLNWFVALASPGNGGLKLFLTWSAWISIAACALLMMFGTQALSQGYLARVHTLLRSGPAGRRRHSGGFGTVVRLLTGKPSGRAAASFLYTMARTDWQFRRSAYPALIQIIILPLLGFVRGGLGHSPFIAGSPTVAHFLPHFSGMVGLLFCFAITSSDQYRAAWIFLTFPEDAIRSFVRGIFFALWLPINAVTFVIAPVLIWRWGLADGALFTLYSLAVGSFYLSLQLFMIDGLPFANPPQSMKGSMIAPLVIAGLIGALILVGLQWLFIFQSRFVTAGAILVFSGGAYVIARTSLPYLETNVRHNLHRIGAGRTAMFKEVSI
jgi:hypothetical protein